MSEKITQFPISIDIGGTLSKICIFLEEDFEIPSFLTCDTKIPPNILYRANKKGEFIISLLFF